MDYYPPSPSLLQPEPLEPRHRDLWGRGARSEEAPGLPSPPVEEKQVPLFPAFCWGGWGWEGEVQTAPPAIPLSPRRGPGVLRGFGPRDPRHLRSSFLWTLERGGFNLLQDAFSPLNYFIGVKYAHRKLCKSKSTAGWIGTGWAGPRSQHPDQNMAPHWDPESLDNTFP